MIAVKEIVQLLFNSIGTVPIIWLSAANQLLDMFGTELALFPITNFGLLITAKHDLTVCPHFVTFHDFQKRQESRVLDKTESDRR